MPWWEQGEIKFAIANLIFSSTRRNVEYLKRQIFRRILCSKTQKHLHVRHKKMIPFKLGNLYRIKLHCIYDPYRSKNIVLLLQNTFTY